MHIHKTSRLAMAVALAAALSACDAGSDNDNNNGGNQSGPTFEECLETVAANNDGVVTTVQIAGCRTLADTPAGATNNILQDLLFGSSLSAVIVQLNDLTPEELNDLLLMLTGDEALGPVLDAVQSILAALNAGGDPTAIADALQGLLGDGMPGGADGSPLDALTNLGDLLGGDGAEGLLSALQSGDPTAIADELQALLSGLNGGGSGGSGSGLIDSVEGLIANLTDDTALAQLQDVVSQLAGADEGALAAITGPLNDLTADQLVALTDLVNQLAVDPGSPVGGVVDALNDALAQLTGGGAPDAGGLGDLLTGLLGGLA